MDTKTDLNGISAYFLNNFRKFRRPDIRKAFNRTGKSPEDHRREMRQRPFVKVG
jgi:hypothetical protein